MYVIAVHSISDPQAFWGVCIFKSDSVDTVRKLVDGATAAISKNEFFAMNEKNAQGLSV